MPDTSNQCQDQFPKSKKSNYLFVDLDGTLIRTDLFVESVVKLIKKNPANILNLIRWTLKGRSVVKALAARRIKLDPEALPYEAELVDYIKQEKAAGRHVILATASHWSYATRVAAHLGLFDRVIASTAKENVKGRRKLLKIKEGLDGADFSYAGDSPADRPIWEESASAILVNARPADVDRLKRHGKCEKVITSRKPWLIPLTQARLYAVTAVERPFGGCRV